MPEILGTVESVSADSSTGSFTQVDDMTLTVTVAGTGSVILLVAHVTIAAGGSSDIGAEFRLTEGGSPVGAVMGAVNDGVDETLAMGVVFAVTGLSAGDHTFTLEWANRQGSASTDTSRNRTLQVIELLAAEATILVDVVSQTADSAPATFADVDQFSGSGTVDGTGDIILMLANLMQKSAADNSYLMQFAVGGTREGPEISPTWSDSSAGRVGGGFLCYAADGFTAGSKTWSCQWEQFEDVSDTDEARNRSFQIIKLSTAAFLVDVISTSAGSAPAAYADIPDFSGAGTPQASGSVELFLGVVQTVAPADSAEETSDYRFADDGTREGPEMTLSFGDGSNAGDMGNGGMIWAKTGITGEHDFSMQWQDRIPQQPLDTTRNRSFHVIDLQSAAAPQTITPDAAVLNLVVPTHKVNRKVLPDPTVLTLVAPAITIMETVKLDPAILTLNVPDIRVERIVAPDPATLNLAIPAHKVNRLIRPDAAALNLAVPPVKITETVKLDPAILTLNVPDVKITETVKPDPAVLNLAIPEHRVNRLVKPNPAVLNLAIPNPAVMLGNIVPDPVVLTLNAPDIRVNRLVRPDPAVLALNVPPHKVNRVIQPAPATLNLAVPDPSILRTIAPDAVVLNLVIPNHKVNQAITPDPAVLSLVVPPHRVNRTIVPDPATLNLVVPPHAVDRVVAPDPATLNLAVPDHKVNRLIRPAPVVLTLNVPDIRVNRLIQPDPVVLTLVVPLITIERGLRLFPDPAILFLQAQAINRVGGISVPPFIVQIDEDSPTARFNGTNTMVVFANSSADARAIAKAKFGGDADPAWDDAQVTEVVQATDAEGFRLRVAILDSSPIVDVSVLGGPADQIDDLGLAMAAQLNLEPIIGGAVYTVGTNVLIVAAGSGADDLGDRTLVVELLAPSSNVAIPGGVVSITDQGASTDDLSTTLAPDTFLIPDVHMTAKRSEPG